MPSPASMRSAPGSGAATPRPAAASRVSTRSRSAPGHPRCACEASVSALAEHVAAVAREAGARAAQWEVLAIERADTAVDLGSGVADTLRSSAETTLCLRVYRDGRAGTATTTRPADAR